MSIVRVDQQLGPAVAVGIELIEDRLEIEVIAQRNWGFALPQALGPTGIIPKQSRRRVGAIRSGFEPGRHDECGSSCECPAGANKQARVAVRSKTEGMQVVFQKALVTNQAFVGVQPFFEPWAGVPDGEWQRLDARAGRIGEETGVDGRYLLLHARG